jgi:hypothetical protein
MEVVGYNYFLELMEERLPALCFGLVLVLVWCCSGGPVEGIQYLFIFQPSE